MRRSSISLFQSSTTIITGNNITDSEIAIQISASDYTVISENRMSTIFFEGSSHITINENMFLSGGIALSNEEGDNIAYWNTHSINDNTLNGKPIYYYKNTKDIMTVPADAAQVILANCSNATIQGLNITNVASGIQLGFSSHNTISRNTITAMQLQAYFLFAALFLIQSSNNTISENSMSNSTVGILAWSSSHHTIIERNTITHNEFGLILFSSDNAQIFENNISDNGNGLYAEESNEDVIARNTIKNNHEYGIAGGFSHSDIFENTIQDNHDGIYLYTSFNRLYHNNFINNIENAYDGGNNIWNSSYPSGGNYWDDYTGVDEYSGPEQNIPGPDGINDTSYEFNVFDQYPFMEPDGWNNVCPVLSFVTFAGGGLVTCPAGDGPVYQYATVIVRDFDGEPISGIPAEELLFAVSPTDDTRWYGTFSCTFIPVDPITDENGEIRFTIQGDTSIVGNITIQATVMGYQLQDTDILPCKSMDYDTNGVVNLADFILFGRDYGTTTYRSDFTWDGTVNLLDFVIFGEHYGHHMP
jgi:parallel beta-helix repeat protein